MRIFYFGCIGDSGHCLWDHNLRSVHRSHSKIPWKKKDAVLCPQTTAKNGVAKMHYKDGWMAIAFWDNSVDGRPGSNSVFFLEDLIDFDHALLEFKEQFPKIFNRFNFEITEFIPPEENEGF